MEEKVFLSLKQKHEWSNVQTKQTGHVKWIRTIFESQDRQSSQTKCTKRSHKLRIQWFLGISKCIVRNIRHRTFSKKVLQKRRPVYFFSGLREPSNTISKKYVCPRFKVGVGSLIVGYTIFGAFMFRAVETSADIAQDHVADINQTVQAAVRKLWVITNEYNLLNKRYKKQQRANCHLIFV